MNILVNINSIHFYVLLFLSWRHIIYCIILHETQFIFKFLKYLKYLSR